MHFVALTLLWNIVVLGCSNSPETSQTPQTTPVQEHEDKPDLDALVRRWKRSQNDFTARMKSLSDMERLYVVRQVLANPKAEHSPRLCQTLSKQHHAYCIEMLGRSHIWDIPIEDNGNLESESNLDNTSCASNDVWCLTNDAVQNAKHGHPDTARKLCASLPDTQAREECFFQTAEQVAKQDQHKSLETAFQLCAETTAYRSHCHAHIIEFAATTFQSPTEQLNVIKQYGASKSEFLQQYYLTMKARHSPQNPHLPHWDKHSVQTLLFLQRQTKVDRSLTEWIARFHDAIPTLKLDSLNLDGEMSSHWIQHGRAQHLSTLYLSLESRPYSENEALDLKMAMIAALIQLQFPVTAVTNEVSHPTFQWMLNRASHKR